MVYTYIAYSNKKYKIGQSKYPVSRIKKMSTANPDIKLIAYGVGVSEKDLHEEFELYRKKGEWFELNAKNVRKAIQMINNEFDGYGFKAITIDFGKYNQTPLRDMRSLKQKSYLRWYIKNGSNKWWVSKFKEHLKRLKKK